MLVLSLWKWSLIGKCKYYSSKNLGNYEIVKCSMLLFACVFVCCHISWLEVNIAAGRYCWHMYVTQHLRSKCERNASPKPHSEFKKSLHYIDRLSQKTKQHKTNERSVALWFSEIISYHWLLPCAWSICLLILTHIVWWMLSNQMWGRNNI